jgi:hypothetical protein
MKGFEKTFELYESNLQFLTFHISKNTNHKHSIDSSPY